MLTFLALFLFSCEKESTTYTSYDDLFQQTITKYQEIGEDDTVYISYDYDNTTEKIIVRNTEVKELNFFLLESESYIKAKKENGEYSVECNYKNGSVTTIECDGTRSCGLAIKKCLDGGGCAEICRSTIIYIPSTRSFICILYSCLLPKGSGSDFYI